MKTYFAAALLLLSGVLASAVSAAAPRTEWFRGLRLEAATANSNLILAAEIVDVSPIEMNFGGKMGRITNHQYRVKSVLVLKGIFARQEMTLTDSDLGIYGENETTEFKKGSLILLFLGRSDVGYRNANRTGNEGIAQSIPTLEGTEDPLLDAVRTLLDVNAEPDRAKRVSMLLGGLNKAGGAGAAALLDSLRSRALIAAQDRSVMPPLAKQLADDSPAVREAAANTVREILEADYLETAELRAPAAEALATALEKKSTNIAARASIYRAIGALGAAGRANEKVRRQLEAEHAGEAIEEESARIAAIGSLKLDAAGPRKLLHTLPLDAEGDLQYDAAFTLAKLDPAEAARQLKERFDARLAAGLDGEDILGVFDQLPPEIEVPLLLETAKLPLNRSEKAEFAQVCRKLCVDDRRPDARLAAPLAGMLAPTEPARNAAMDALIAIDNEEAARALREHLKDEADLYRKLRIAEMLGRHGIADGFPYAMEHLSEGGLLEQAVKTLAAIEGSRKEARDELKHILETSNDAAWNAAAIRALGALGATEMAAKFLEVASDFRNPLAEPALMALGDLGEPKTVERIKQGLASRNDRIVTAAVRATGKLVAARPELKSADLRNNLASLLADSEADYEVRNAALDTLLAFKDEHLNEILVKIVREAHLENSGLMGRVETLLRERKVKLE